jgi:hypothetical protein
MPVFETKGALSAQGYGLTTSIPQRNYIEDVFSTWLYRGTGASQTITNNISLSTSGGMVWIKGRSTATDHAIYDTARGATFDIASNTTAAQTTQATGLTAFSTTGFTIGALAKINTNAESYASWTFRKQPKFFDIVTYTGTGVNRTIAHNLGSVPGSIFVKRTDATANWQVYHRSLANTQYMVLNSTAAVATDATRWNSTTPTSTVFSLGTDTTVNASGGTYVAYIFAHNAGGFGNAGTDNVISCGSYTGTSAAGVNVTLGYEPQWVLVKGAGNAFDWYDMDTMRGLSNTDTFYLAPNTSAAESNFGSAGLVPTATGFRIDSPGAGLNASGVTYIYIAIRRGPMKTPTVGTSVYQAFTTAAGVFGVPSGLQFADTLLATTDRFNNVAKHEFYDRLRGIGQSGGTSVYLVTEQASAETSVTASNSASGVSTTTSALSNNFIAASLGGNGGTTSGAIAYWFRRFPGFFDVVCYTGTGANTTQAHNLGVVPELIIVKRRSGATAWQVYSSVLANTEYLVLNTTAAKATGITRWNSTTPTGTVFSLGTASEVNTSSATYVAYLFATVAGVNKVGSYTGTGATLAVNCGFTTGARFILIKRTDLVDDWYVWDSTRGIVAGSDPYIRLNSTAAEVTSTDWVDTAASGFELSNSVGNLVNVVGGTYLFLSIA